MRYPASWHSTTRQLRLSAGFLAGALVQTGCYPGLYRDDDRIGTGDGDDEEVEAVAGQADESSLERPADNGFDVVLGGQPIVRPLPDEDTDTAEPAAKPAALAAAAAAIAKQAAPRRRSAPADAVDAIDVVDMTSTQPLVADARTGATPVRTEPRPSSLPRARPCPRPRDPAVRSMESSRAPSQGLLTSGSYGYAPIGGLY